MKPAPLVTKQSLKELITKDPARVIGRALVALFHRQTEVEKHNNVTRLQNGVGFTGTDGRIGAITAKYYMKYGTLLDWQIANWMKPNRKGEPRIVKYAGQLNDIAVAKQARTNMEIFKIPAYETV